MKPKRANTGAITASPKKRYHKQHNLDNDITVAKLKVLLENPGMVFHACSLFVKNAPIENGHGDVWREEDEGKADIVYDYCRSSPECTEIVSLLLDGSNFEKKEVHVILKAIAVILESLNGYLKLKLPSLAYLIVKSIQSRYQAVLEYAVEEKMPSRTVIALELLTLISTIEPSLLFNTLTFNKHLITSLSSTGKKKIRHTFIRFLLALIKSAPAELIQDIVTEKNLLNAMFWSLDSDPFELCEEILRVLRLKVVCSQIITKTQRIKLFNETSLPQIISTYNWSGEEKTSGKKVEHSYLVTIREQLSMLISTLLSDVKYSIVFRDSNFGFDTKNQNHVITTALTKSLLSEAYQYSELSDVIVKCLSACPDQIHYYLDQLESKVLSNIDHTYWIAAANHIIKIYYSLPLVDKILKLDKLTTVEQLEQASTVILLPRSNVMNCFSKALTNGTNTHRYTSLGLYKVISERTVTCIDVISSSIVKPELIETCRNIIIRKLLPAQGASGLPSIQMLFQMWKYMLENQHVDSVLLGGRIVEIFQQYQQFNPVMFYQTQKPFNMSLILSGIKQVADGNVEREINLTLEALKLLQHLPREAAQAVIKTSTADSNTLRSLLTLLYDDKSVLTQRVSDQIKTECKQILTRVLCNTDLFEENSLEVDTWLNTPHVDIQYLETIIRELIGNWVAYTDKYGQIVGDHFSVPFSMLVLIAVNTYFKMHDSESDKTEQIRKYLSTVLITILIRQEDPETLCTRIISKLPECETFHFVKSVAQQCMALKRKSVDSRELKVRPSFLFDLYEIRIDGVLLSDVQYKPTLNNCGELIYREILYTKELYTHHTCMLLWMFRDTEDVLEDLINYLRLDETVQKMTSITDLIKHPFIRKYLYQLFSNWGDDVDSDSDSDAEPTEKPDEEPQSKLLYKFVSQFLYKTDLTEEEIHIVEDFTKDFIQTTVLGNYPLDYPNIQLLLEVSTSFIPYMSRQLLEQLMSKLEWLIDNRPVEFDESAQFVGCLEEILDNLKPGLDNQIGEFVQKTRKRIHYRRITTATLVRLAQTIDDVTLLIDVDDVASQILIWSIGNHGQVIDTELLIWMIKNLPLCGEELVNEAINQYDQSEKFDEERNINLMKTVTSILTHNETPTNVSKRNQKKLLSIFQHLLIEDLREDNSENLISLYDIISQIVNDRLLSELADSIKTQNIFPNNSMSSSLINPVTEIYTKILLKRGDIDATLPYLKLNSGCYPLLVETLDNLNLSSEKLLDIFDSIHSTDRDMMMDPNFLRLLAFFFHPSRGLAEMNCGSKFSVVLEHAGIREMLINDVKPEQTEIKHAVISLLNMLVLSDPVSVARLDSIKQYCQILLNNYNATLSQQDQLIYQILVVLETRGQLNTTSCRPFIWGNGSYSYYTSRSNIESKLSLTQLGVEAVISKLDVNKLKQSVINFPLNRTLDSNQIYESTTVDEELYDPAFLLPLFAYILRPDHQIRTRLLIQKNVVMYLLAALTSHNEDIRAATRYCLNEFQQHMESSEYGESVQGLYMFNLLSESITDKNGRLSPIMCLFLSEALSLTPDSYMYKVLQSFLLLKPRLELEQPPEFYRLFNSTSYQFKMERTWILRLLLDGLREDSDFRLYLNLSVFKIIQSYASCTLSSTDDRGLILDIILRASSLPVSHSILINRSIVSWINNIIIKYDCVRPGLKIIEALITSVTQTDSTENWHTSFYEGVLQSLIQFSLIKTNNSNNTNQTNNNNNSKLIAWDTVDLYLNLISQLIQTLEKLSGTETIQLYIQRSTIDRLYELCDDSEPRNLQLVKNIQRSIRNSRHHNESGESDNESVASVEEW